MRMVSYLVDGDAANVVVGSLKYAAVGVFYLWMGKEGVRGRVMWFDVVV